MVRCHLSCIRSAADAAPTGRARCPNPLGEPFGGTLWGGGAAHNPSSCCRPLSPITAPRPCRPASYQGPTRRRPQPLPRARRRRAGGAAGAASAAAAAAAQHNTHRVAEWCSTGPHTCRPPRRSQPHRRHRSREAIKQNPRGTPPRPPQPPRPPLCSDDLPATLAARLCVWQPPPRSRWPRSTSSGETLPLPCLPAAIVPKTAPLPCLSAVIVAKTAPLPCGQRLLGLCGGRWAV